MLELFRRPPGRLFYCLISLTIACALRAPAQAPALTTVADTVYRANGQPAKGTLFISWPAFITADNRAVAAGQTSVTIGDTGALSVQLAPNAGANPAGLYYTVVYRLTEASNAIGAGHVEYWTVPAASPATLAQVRATLMPPRVATQWASQTYVNAAVTPKADTATVNTALAAKLGRQGDTASALYVDNPTTDVISFNVSSTSSDGARSRFKIENNPAGPVDMHIRNVAMNVGSVDGGASPLVTQNFYSPPASSGQYLRLFRAGSSANTAGYWGVNGDLHLNVGGVSSTAFTIGAFGEANRKFSLSEFGELKWGPGGASALDAGLKRGGAAQLEVTNAASGQGSIRASVVRLGAGNVTLSTGAGAPSGACNTGSVYLRSDGTAGATLYVCQASAWAAK